LTQPAALGVAAAAAAIRAGTLTSVELVDACLERIAATDEALRAWVELDVEGARAGARARDTEKTAAKAAESELGRLHGVPVGIKDIIDVAGLPTRAGAPAFAHRRPTIDAAVVSRLRAAGAVILGKTATTPFAYLDPAPTTNPWSAGHTPGGSSSGSAAAVAARQVPAAIGTQTGGSILRPAAYCGLVGLKGPHGSVPVQGVFPLAPSLDHVGPLARSVADASLVWRVLAGRPAEDPREPRPPRLAFDPDLIVRADPELREQLVAVLAAVRGAGATLTRVTVDDRIDDVGRAGRTVMAVEAARVHADGFAEHADEYAPAIAELITTGQAVSPDDLAAAERQRSAFRNETSAWLDTHDAFLSPVALGPAPKRGVGTGDYALCIPWSFIGVPSLSLPTGMSADGLPFAIQLTGGSGADSTDRLLGAAAWVERQVAFDARPAGSPAT
jgi:Asp-tRNA(Asn)/Glu-tRNA(Gln) amidotransferase A subunit family amidase